MKKLFKTGIIVGLIVLVLCVGYAVIKDMNSKKNTSAGNAYPNVSADFKKFWDEYEAVINEYCDFMEKYNKGGGNAIGMFADYTKMMKKYADMTSAASKYDQKNMTNEELSYYMDVMNRVQKRLLSINKK